MSTQPSPSTSATCQSTEQVLVHTRSKSSLRLRVAYAYVGRVCACIANTGCVVLLTLVGETLVKLPSDFVDALPKRTCTPFTAVPALLPPPYATTTSTTPSLFMSAPEICRTRPSMDVRTPLLAADCHLSSACAKVRFTSPTPPVPRSVLVPLDGLRITCDMSSASYYPPYILVHTQMNESLLAPRIPLRLRAKDRSLRRH